MALRFDITKLDNTKRDHNGYLVADAHATRIGVFKYRHSDGSVTRELRHPDDVFKSHSINSLKNRPVTDGHPMQGRVNAENTRSLSVGSTIDEPKQEGQYLDTNVQITDEAVINKVMADENPLREISCGYDTDVIKEDGVFQGEDYDHRQTNIIYNHIALVKRGRAGHEVRLKLDSADAVIDGYEDILKTDVEETEENIHIPVRGSEQFKDGSFKTTPLKGVSGVNLVVGRLKKPQKGEEGSAVAQKFIFSKKNFTMKQAKSFMEKHKNDEAELVKFGNINQTTGSNQSKEDSDMIRMKREAVKIRSFNMDAFEIQIDEGIESGEKAVELVISKLDAAIEHIRTLEGEKDRLQGRMDNMDDLGKVTLSKLNDHVKERTNAIAAAHYLGMKREDYTDLETEDIKKAVVLKAYPAVKIDELTKERIEGRYDSILEGIDTESQNLKSMNELRGGGDHSKFPIHADESDPRTKFLNDTQDMYKSKEQRELDS